MTKNLGKIITATCRLCLIFSSSPVLSCSSISEREKVATFVFETDFGYMTPTCAAITSLCETTPVPKNIVVVQDGSIDEGSVNSIEGIGKKYENTSVIVYELSQDINKKICKMDMGKWSKMVAARLFYPNIFSGLFSNKEYKKRLIGSDSFSDFMHIDSDAIVVKDISGFYAECRQSGRAIQSTRLHYFMFPFEFDEKYCGKPAAGGVSGGVVFFHLDMLDQDDILNKYNNLCDDLKKKSANERNCLALWHKAVEFCIEQKSDKERICSLLKDLEYDAIGTLSKLRGCDLQFLSTLLSLADVYPIEYWIAQFKNLLSSDFASIEEFVRYEQDAMTIPHITEEVVFNSCDSFSSHDARYNFVPKYIIPELDNTPEIDYEWNKKWKKGAFKYSDICNGELKSGRTDVWEDWSNLHILHYDGCWKPWNDHFINLAKKDDNVMILVYVYAYFLDKIKDIIPFVNEAMLELTDSLSSSSAVDPSFRENPTLALSRIDNEYTKLAKLAYEKSNL